MNPAHSHSYPDDSMMLPTTPLFQPLGQVDYLQLEHAAYLKGLLKPFKGKGALATWANECAATRDGLIELAQRRILPQARGYPYSLLPIYLAQQRTAAGTVFLRWRSLDHKHMGGQLWQQQINNPRLPARLREALYAIEAERIVFNMQISLLHTLARQAEDCVGKLQGMSASLSAVG